MDVIDSGRKTRERDYHDRVFGEDLRAETGRFYSIAGSIKKRYADLVMDGVQGRRVLEYGCAQGGFLIRLAREGAETVGIDISGVAVEQARARAEREGFPGARFEVMDAEHLEFPDDSFDIVCGTGVLHHLDMERSLGEIARVLRPDGFAAFVEPMGHNPLINVFRNRTPGMRTIDEHPLLREDFRMAGRLFASVTAEHKYLCAIGAVPFRKTPLFGPVLGMLEAADRALFAVIPPIRFYSWMALIVLSKPFKQKG